MIRILLSLIIVGAVFFLSAPITWAQGESAAQARLRIINDELNTIEANSDNNPIQLGPVIVTHNQSAVLSKVSQKTSQNTPQIVSPNTSSNAAQNSAQNAPQVTSSNVSHNVFQRKNDFEFGPDFYWAKYQQPNVGHEKGFLIGYNTRYTFRTEPKYHLINMYRVEGQWASGRFKYQSADGLVNYTGVKDDTYDIRGLLGKDFYPSVVLRATPYSGFGYRYLEDNQEGLNAVISDFTVQGYKTFEHYCYIPFGLDLLYQSNPKYSLGSNFEFDYLVRGWEVSKLGVVPGYDTTVNVQDRGFGIRTSLRLNLYFKYFDAYLEGFFRYWDIGQSNSLPDPTDPTNPPLYVPKNNTEEVGIRLGLEV